MLSGDTLDINISEAHSFSQFQDTVRMPVMRYFISASCREEHAFSHQSELFPLYIASRKLSSSVQLFSLSDSSHRKHAPTRVQCIKVYAIHDISEFINSLVHRALFATWNAILCVAIFSIHSHISKVRKYPENFNA